MRHRRWLRVKVRMMRSAQVGAPIKGERKVNSERRGRTARAFSFLAVFLSATVVCGPAAVAAPSSDGKGDPIFGDETAQPPQLVRSFAASPTALTDITSWFPAVTTGASTSAYIDLETSRVFQAARSEIPMLLFSSDLQSGALLGKESISDTSGSWDMARSGDLLAVGTNGSSTARPRIVVKNLVTGTTVIDKELPTSSATSAYVMSVVADAVDDGVFWVGTYQASGPRLYRFDSQTEKFTDVTPGNAWSGSGQKYVRSLTATVDGLLIGLGVARGEVWALPRGASLPHAVDALGGTSVQSVYAMASPSSSGLAETDSSFSVASRSVSDGPSAEIVLSLSEEDEEGAEIAGADESKDDSNAEDGEGGEYVEQADDSEGVEEEPAQSGQSSEISEPVGSAPPDLDPTDPDLLPASSPDTIVVIGTEAPATLTVATGQGSHLRTIALGDEYSVVDRLVIDENRTAWFTGRPSGMLFSLDLDDPEASLREWGPIIEGSETRALATQGSIVYGATGTRETWSFDWKTGQVSVAQMAVESSLEQADINPQGVIATSTRTLVGGHWRYQTHGQADSSTLSLSGEPKAQVRVGDTVYSAVYPSASLYKIGSRASTAQFVARAPQYQVRPRALAHNPSTRQLYMATSGAYGTYGGGVSVVNFSTNALEFFPSPVPRQMPFSLSAIGSDAVVGFSTAGEAMPANPNDIPVVIRWSPTEGIRWSHSVPRATHVTGLATVTDEAGQFIFGITSAGEAFALDGETGKKLWSEQLSGAVRLSAAGNYILVMTSQGWREYFPTRSVLTAGQVVLPSASVVNVQELSSSTYTVAAVDSSTGAAMRGRVINPRQVKREAGIDRYRTAVNVSASTFAQSDYAILATGLDFPDALTAGPLAAARNAPVLLTKGDQVHPDVWEELKRLKVHTVVIVGGTGAVPVSVQRQLEEKGLSVTRLSGSTRYDTALAVAREVRRVRGRSVPAVVTTGVVFPDALSATPAAATMGGVIVLSRGDVLSASSANYLRSSSVSSIATVGGLAQKSVEREGLVPSWSASGKDRYQTSALVAQRMYPSAREALVATGMSFPDGLAAGAVSQGKKPVVLTRSTSLSPAAVEPLEKALIVTLVGGKGALGESVAQEIKNL